MLSVILAIMIMKMTLNGPKIDSMLNHLLVNLEKLVIRLGRHPKELYLTPIYSYHLILCLTVAILFYF